LLRYARNDGGVATAPHYQQEIPAFTGMTVIRSGHARPVISDQKRKAVPT
jgi:hypothetical protein